MKGTYHTRGKEDPPMQSARLVYCILLAMAVSLVCCSPCAAAEYVPDAHTWALYHFSDNYQDSSGNNRHLTVQNPHGYVGFADSLPGFGKALYVSQTSQEWSNQTWIYSPQLRYPGTGSWTVEALVFVPVENTWGLKVAEHYSEHIAGHEPYGLLYYVSTGKARWYINNTLIVEGPMTQGQWHHIAGVYDDAEHKIKIYVDCDLKQELSVASPPENLQAYNVYIDGDWFGSYGPAYLDELRISNKARTPDEFPCGNHPPVADPNGPYIEQATSWDGALVQLDGSASSDPDGDPLTYSWRICDGDEIGTDPIVTYEFPIGETSVSLTVTDPSGECDTETTTVTVTAGQVQIDIKPGSDPNSINLSSHGVIPVAFLTDEQFDASTIDPATVTLAGQDFCGLVKMRGKQGEVPMANLEDVDGDGDLDLVVHLVTENLTLEPTATFCVLGALTTDGHVVQGQDFVNIVPQ
jgi:hypothetical protein